MPQMQRNIQDTGYGMIHVFAKLEKEQCEVYWHWKIITIAFGPDSYRFSISVKLILFSTVGLWYN